MRKTFTASLAIAIAAGVLAVAGCGDDADGGADESLPAGVGINVSSRRAD